MTTIRAGAALTVALLVSMPTMAQTGGATPVRFTVRVENVSTAQTLTLSNGTTAPAPSAPILWTISKTGAPQFTSGKSDRGHGLEALAEDGNPGVLNDYLTKHPGGVSSHGIVNTPVGETAAGPIGPGQAYEFTVSAAPTERLALAMMFVQSNDLFYASGNTGIALFDAKGMPLTSDVTSQLTLCDAGTEVNEEPGLGPNQAHRQSGPNTGPDEHGTVRPVGDRFTYPKTADVIRVTIKPMMHQTVTGGD